MSIRFDGKNLVFHLDTPNTTYLFGLYGGRIPTHIHYGKKSVLRCEIAVTSRAK